MPKLSNRHHCVFVSAKAKNLAKGSLFLALIFLLVVPEQGCRANPDADLTRQGSDSQKALYGTTSNGSTYSGCTDDEIMVYDRALKWGRSVVSSDGFSKCVHIGAAYGIQIPWELNEDGTCCHRWLTTGPYDPCPRDPPDKDASDILFELRSTHDVTYRCDHNLEVAGMVNLEDMSVEQNGGPETFWFGKPIWNKVKHLNDPVCLTQEDWQSGDGDCRQFPFPDPYDYAAEIAVHELVHTHGYWDGQNCNYPNEDHGYPAPYLVSDCVKYMLGRSHDLCQGLHPATSECPDGLRLVADPYDMDGSSCRCYPDPNSRDWNEVEVTVEHLYPHSNYKHRSKFTIPERGIIEGVVDTSQKMRFSITQTLPKPSFVSWMIQSAAGGSASFFGDLAEIYVRPGDVIHVNVLSENDEFQPGILGPMDLHFDLDVIPVHTVPTTAPSAPYNLEQSIPVLDQGVYVILQDYDMNSGCLAHDTVSISAVTDCWPEWPNMNCQLEFSLRDRTDGNVLRSEVMDASPGEPVNYGLGQLEPGSYVWEVKAIGNNGQESATVAFPTNSQGLPLFGVGFSGFLETNIPPSNPQSLSTVLAYEAILTSNIDRDIIPPGDEIDYPDGTAILSATSWDLNGTAVSFEYEIRAYDESFSGQATHIDNSLLAPQAGAACLQVSSVISMPFDGNNIYFWQVRAESDGEFSEWVTGGAFPSHQAKDAMEIFANTYDGRVDREYEFRVEPPLEDLMDRVYGHEIPDITPYDRRGFEHYYNGISGLFYKYIPSRELESLERLGVIDDSRYALDPGRIQTIRLGRVDFPLGVSGVALSVDPSFYDAVQNFTLR